MLEPLSNLGVILLDHNAVYVAFGSNLSTVKFPNPVETVLAAIQKLDACASVELIQTAPLYETEPVPKSDQKWYVNTVSAYTTSLESEAFMALCHEVEEVMVREGSVPNAARVIDIDLIDFKSEIRGRGADKSEQLVLPHPSACDRAFVLRPLADLAPRWCDPVSGQVVSALISNLPAEQALGLGIRMLT